ncbi:MAG: excinuclease ABC subunit UvrC [Hydrogenobacter sp.]|uniref:excinuclease ABC subunit UvrC n=1 Tax=Hydrogenobacter thermophilus TaxID=940 RepID=UPI0030FAE069
MITQEVIQSAPEKTGVYIFKKSDKVIYIGKAKNIRERLLQHYRLSEKDSKEKAILMDSEQIEWIITRNEFEALTLEVDLIQLHKPKYNVLHKYGGGYPLLLLTDDRFPTVKIVRGYEKGMIFGPFFSTGKARKVKKLIHKLFKLRTCDPIPVRKEPCMDYHLGLCSAPCCGYVNADEYALNVRSAISLLSGDVSSVLPDLYEAIERYSLELKFEKCAQIRDQIHALENLAKGQRVSQISLHNADIFYSMGRLLGVFLVRSSKLVDKQIILLDTESQREEVILGFYYSNPLPENLITNFDLPAEVKEWLSKRGKLRLGTITDKELESIIRENMGHHVDIKVLELEFKERLGISLPYIIEGFDVSHFYGDYIVASCVVWERGYMNKKRYRRYRIKSVNKIDDYTSLMEVLERRAKRLKSGEEVMPDAWLIDGGYGQMGVALKVKRKMALPIKIFALAKREEILLCEDGKEIHLKENPILYRVFGLIRDEAHRFALAYSRRLKLKDTTQDILNHIKGIGKVKKQIIYRNFENLYELLTAEDEKLKKLGISPQIKQDVRKYLEGD